MSLTRKAQSIIDGVQNSRLRPIWRIVAVLVTMTPVYYGGQLLLFRAVRSADLGEIGGIVSIAGQTVTVALALLIAVASVRRLGNQSLQQYGIENSSVWWRDLIGGLGIGAAATIGTVGYLIAGGGAELAVESSGTGSETVSIAVAAVLAILALVIVNSTLEEFVFRGVVISNASEGLQARRASLWTASLIAVGVSATLFGLFHFLDGPFEIVSSAMMGIFWGVAYLFTGRLALPLGAHIGNISFFVLFQGQFAGFTLPTFILVETVGEPTLFEGFQLWGTRVMIGISLVILWVFVFYDRVGIHKKFIHNMQ